MKTGKGNTMYTRKEAADYLGCSVSFLEKKAMNEPELIPFSKIGKKVRYRETDLNNYISNSTKKH